MKARILTVLLAVLALAAPARGAFAAATCTLRKVADLPVTMVNLRPMISAQINGQDVKLFIDTGAFMSTLSPSAATRLGLRTGALPPWVHIQGLTGEADMRLASVKVFAFLDVPFHNVDFLVGEHGLSADGLIGEDVLGRLDIEYDFANGVVRLFSPANCGANDVLAYWSQDGVIGVASLTPSMNQRSKDIIGAATLNGRQIHVLLDTGTPRSAVKLSAARRAGIDVAAPGVVSAGLAQGVGRRTIASWLAPFDSFEFGGEQIKGSKLRVADYELDEADMLLGTDFFLSHRILISRSQNRIYFTYNGGRVFNLEEGPAPASTTTQASGQSPLETPKGAAGFSRRAAAEGARQEYDQAIADETSAIGLEPTNATYLYDRAATRVRAKQPLLAMDDLNHALTLKPDLEPALLLRGELKLAGHDRPGAKADFDAAVRMSPAAAVRVGVIYLTLGDFETAVTDLSLWIDSQPKGEDLAPALASRCRARALWNHDLDQAMTDCIQAIRYRSDVGAYFASRGLVQMRLGKLDPALADFNHAVSLQANIPWALYGRGVVELRQGKKTEGDADLAAAAALDPRIAQQAAKVGLAL